MATAVIDFLTTALVTQPRPNDKPLRGDLAGIWAARRGTYGCFTGCAKTPTRSSCCASNTDETPTVRTDAPGLATTSR